MRPDPAPARRGVAALPGRTPVERVAAAERGRLLALLVRELRSLDLAEDALAEAELAALEQWPAAGAPPANPAAWLLTVARRRARDALRREATLARKLPLLIVDTPSSHPPPSLPDETPPPLTDDRLRMLFCACHPALAPASQVALTLRFAAGLTTQEVARLLLVSEPTMAARLTRAKRKVAGAGIPFRVPGPDALPSRLAGVLTVVAGLFTEGYLAASGPALTRPELCDEAIRLGRLLCELVPADPEVVGLLALMALQHARRDARVSASGAVVRLADQDRSRWRADELREGAALAVRAAESLGRNAAGPYLLQALIAAEHADAGADGPDGRAIAAFYAALGRVDPSPAVTLNRALAVAESTGAADGLTLLEGLDAALGHTHGLWLARAELLARLGRDAEARAAFDRAAALAANDAVRAHVLARRRDLAV